MKITLLIVLISILGVSSLLAQALTPQQSRPQSLSAKLQDTTRRTTTVRRPVVRKKACTKQPPNFREINLPCGGYDRKGCQLLCHELEYTKFYCRKEEFCLCHSGDLYSC